MGKAALPPVSSNDKAAALALIPVSRETEARLDRYVDLLAKWQVKTNLIAPSTWPTIWTRHIADSLQLLALAPDAKRWVDLGSGGGFPGVVLACALADQPSADIHLVERNAKKAAFLREALRVSGGRGEVVLSDIGDYVERSDRTVDCITARALAPLHILLGYVEPLMKRGAKALFLKGQDIESELTDATKYWSIAPRLHESRTEGGGFIVEIEALDRK